MRTKWQFGPGDGNIPARTLMGNPHDGDAWQSAGKANRTSSRKINSACRHFFERLHGCCILVSGSGGRIALLAAGNRSRKWIRQINRGKSHSRRRSRG